MICLLGAASASASDDTIRGQARIGYAELLRDQRVVAAAGERVRSGDRGAATELVSAASVLAADMRVAHASVIAELPTTPRGRIGRSLLIQGFAALAAHASWEMQYAKAVMDGLPKGTRAAIDGESSARLNEGTRLVQRGLKLVG